MHGTNVMMMMMMMIMIIIIMATSYDETAFKNKLLKER
jgi:uncharacterized membrane protein YjgN (DUF898 family)